MKESLMFFYSLFEHRFVIRFSTLCFSPGLQVERIRTVVIVLSVE